MACSNQCVQQHFTIWLIQSLAVNSTQVVLCIVLVFQQSVESLLSVDVNVALRAVSLILRQPIALLVAVVERLAGREDAHVKDWADFDVSVVPKTRRHFVPQSLASDRLLAWAAAPRHCLLLGGGLAESCRMGRKNCT